MTGLAAKPSAMVVQPDLAATPKFGMQCARFGWQGEDLAPMGRLQKEIIYLFLPDPVPAPGPR